MGTDLPCWTDLQSASVQTLPRILGSPKLFRGLCWWVVLGSRGNSFPSDYELLHSVTKAPSPVILYPSLFSVIIHNGCNRLTWRQCWSTSWEARWEEEGHQKGERMRREMPRIFKCKKVTRNIMTEVGSGGVDMSCVHITRARAFLVYECCCSIDKSCPTLYDPMDCSTPGFPVLHCLLEFAQTYVHWVMMLSNHLILCCPLLLLPSIFPSIRVFSSELAFHIRWPNYWSFSFSLSPSNEYSGLISFRIDWFDLLAIQRTHKSHLQHHSLKASILQYSAFFMVQLSHLSMTTGRIIALTI